MIGRVDGKVDKCVVCLERDPDTVAMPCAHRVVCEQCSRGLKRDHNNRAVCVFCRQPLEYVYLIKQDKKEEMR